MYIAEGGTSSTPYDWEDPARAKSIPSRLSFSSIHSSHGFSDAQFGEEEDSDEKTNADSNKPASSSTTNNRSTTPAKRFMALEDSAEFSEDSSARRRKRQQEAMAQYEQAKLAGNHAPAPETPDTAIDTEVPKKKKKKRRCIIM